MWTRVDHERWYGWYVNKTTISKQHLFDSSVLSCCTIFKSRKLLSGGGCGRSISWLFSTRHSATRWTNKILILSQNTRVLKINNLGILNKMFWYLDSRRVRCRYMRSIKDYIDSDNLLLLQLWRLITIIIKFNARQIIIRCKDCISVWWFIHMSTLSVGPLLSEIITINTNLS